eukprot:TRINITY_DN9926_c0_g2_i8.p2 TRINITY_DN9926_c0_g2~~TRINITY_DN9926_c0_g2_i8.p2  ORF type:complete len:110 (+),score=12.96 TRINITY_DN9926_c0_g2_i8:486-815(+)
MGTNTTTTTRTQTESILVSAQGIKSRTEKTILKSTNNAAQIQIQTEERVSRVTNSIPTVYNPTWSNESSLSPFLILDSSSKRMEIEKSSSSLTVSSSVLPSTPFPPLYN